MNKSNLSEITVSKKFNQEMLVIGRESRGLTQSALARLLSVSQGKVSKIENGMLGASEDIVKRLSQTLNYPEEFFFLTDPICGPGYGLIYHRKRQNISNKIRGKIHSQINIRSIHLFRLLRAVDMIDSNIPLLDIDEYDGNVEKIARTIRANWSLQRGCVKNLTKAIEDAGGIVIPCDFETRLFDEETHKIQGRPVFFVNAHIPGDRLRFTLAHALGHIVMHRIPNPNMEKEADRFAAELLLPSREIGSSLTNLTLAKLANLKLHWKVSMASLLHRASDLKKISPGKARYLWMQIGKAGYRRREPVELDIPVEKPSLLQEIINTHLHELNYTVPELSQALAIHEREFRAIYFPYEPNLTIVN